MELLSALPSRNFTIIDIGRTQHLILALDVWIEELDKVKVVRRVLPLDEVFDLVLVTDIAAPADDRDGFHDSVDCSQEQSEV